MEPSPAIEDVQHALQAYAQQACAAEKVEVHFLGLDARAVPSDFSQALWEGDPCRSRPDLRVALVARDGSLRSRLTIHPSLSVWVKAPVAAGPVVAGAPVQATDGLVLAERVRGQIPLAAGIARVDLRAGDALTTLVVEAPFDVDSGATVELRVQRGALVVSASGTTLAHGRVGDNVRVVNKATHAALVGVLVDAHTVEIP